jgi:predicted NAD/FAD-dependent oxidoreductase
MTPDFTTRRAPEDSIAWLALDSAKHGRPGPAAWVAQASADWSRTHLECDKDEIATRMLPLVCDRLGIAQDTVLHAVAHRWRYAHASTPLGRPFLSDSGTLFAGGDWALSNRAEGAWASGRAMARAVLDSL